MARLISCLADLAKPLHDLTHKGTAFTWESHHTEAGNKLEEDISSGPGAGLF